MKVDESGAPWPYEPHEASPYDPPNPTWECPGGNCACHPPGAPVDLVDHTIFFFDHRIERMPGARCRILENGRMVNLDAPYASGNGSVTVKLRPSTKTLVLEWAPGHTPVTSRYPYRKRYHVDLGRGDEATRRRLHNIGYSVFRSLSENIDDYQESYGPPDPPTPGRPEHIETQLCHYHDEASLPPPHRGSTTQTRSFLLQNQPTTPAPGGVPSATNQGSTAPPVGKLTVTLSSLFSMRDHYLADKDDVPEKPGWTDHPYDVEAMMKHYFGKPKPGEAPGIAQRPFGLSPEVVGATVTLSSRPGSKSKPTGATGETTISFLQGEQDTQLTLLVEPDPGQLNTSGPAGPALTDANTPADRLYRPFNIHLSIDSAGVVQSLFIEPQIPPRAPSTSATTAPKAITSSSIGAPTTSPPSQRARSAISHAATRRSPTPSTTTRSNARELATPTRPASSSIKRYPRS